MCIAYKFFFADALSALNMPFCRDIVMPPALAKPIILNVLTKWVRVSKDDLETLLFAHRPNPVASLPPYV